jgi:hypothetical protein
MATLPLEVHEVLEDEYRTIYDAEPPDVPLDTFEFLDLPWACSILAQCGIDRSQLGNEEQVSAALRCLLNCGKPSALAASPALTASGATYLRNYGKYDESERRKLNRRIIDAALFGAIKPIRDLRLGALYADLHGKADDEAPTALCISGGGIRSATFALGIIEGLASAKVLSKFRYLSTVSGGGYIGSWLSSWSRRHKDGIEGVEKDLLDADTFVSGHPSPQTKIDPEPAPVRHLRDYSNYLSPRLGVTSGDTWTMVSLYLRNLLLNLLVLVPILALLLAVPRVFALVLHKADWASPTTPLFWMNVALAIGFGYIGLSRPVAQGKGDELVSGQNPAALFILFTVAPLAAAGMFLSAFWARWADAHQPAVQAGKLPWLDIVRSPYFLVAIGLMTLLPWVIYYGRYLTASAASRKSGASRQGGKHFALKLGVETAAAFAGVVTSVALAFLAALKLFDDPLHKIVDPATAGVQPFLRPLHDYIGDGHLYVCLAVPVVLFIFFVQASIFVGISSRRNEDDDREWWGRAGAYLLFSAVGIALLGFLTVYGPLLAFRMPIVLGSLGGVSGVAAAMLGFSAKTSAKHVQNADTKMKLVEAASGLAIPIFVGVLLSSIALGTTWLIEQLDEPKKFDAKQVAFASQFLAQASYTETAVREGTRFSVKHETAKLPEITPLEVRSIAHLQTIQTTTLGQIGWIAGVALAAFGLSFFIGVNKFSMHALYRNRLIRAYLGASRYSRDPDRFTGFDEHDNLQMFELHPDVIWTTTFGDERKFAAEMVKAREQGGDAAAVTNRIWERLPLKTCLALENDWTAGTSHLREELILAINSVLLEVDLAEIVSKEVVEQIHKHGRVRRNRAIMARFLPLDGTPKPMPLHVINTALNLTSGEKLAWQQRQAASFSISPLHAGSLYAGYRRSHKYGGADGISVGTAVTISGAAASPNQGYHSSPAMAFLLTLLNVRLGWWLGNPGAAGHRTHRKSHPWSNVALLANELLGNTNEEYPWVYLSDGGHFENLGLYEMVLRRCRYIVISDAGCDPTFNFEDLGNAIRKIRTDLGVPIDFPKDEFVPRGGDGPVLRKGRYFAIATIRYSVVDGNDPQKDGKLIYIKPGLYENAVFFPKDVYNYATASPAFPHESTADQFFSESQFESYRALGRHAMNEVCGNYAAEGAPRAATYTSVADFVKAVSPRKREEPPRPEEIIAAQLSKLTIAVSRPPRGPRLAPR